jgi:hypothetical protein
MLQVSATLLLSAVLLAGCTGPASPRADAAADAPGDGPAAVGGGRLANATAQTLDSPAMTELPLNNLTEFHWASNETLPGFALEFTAELGDDNDCEVLAGSGSGAGRTGPRNILIRETDDYVGWGSGGSGDLAAAHAGPVDTRTESSGGGSTLHGSSGAVSGSVRFTLLATTVAPVDSPFFREPVSLALSIACAQPFSIHGVSAGSSVALFDAGNLAGGAGAEVFIAGSAAAQDKAAATIAGSRVRAAAAGFGLHGGQVVLDHPRGQETWTVLPSYGVALDQGSSPSTRTAATSPPRWTTPVPTSRPSGWRSGAPTRHSTSARGGALRRPSTLRSDPLATARPARP